MLELQSDCIPCILKQVLRVARVTTENDWLHKRALNTVLKDLEDNDFAASPAEVLSASLASAYKILGTSDPLAEQRRDLPIQLEPLLHDLRERIAAEASLELAATVAAAANFVDKCALTDFDLGASILKAIDQGFARGDPARLVDALKEARTILYILDNAGESEFDLLFAEQLLKRGKKLQLVVKAPGLLHDVTADDLNTEIPTIDTGSTIMGAVPVLCSEQLNQAAERADLVIAKGSSTYQTLPPGGQPLVYLMAVKCAVVARDLGVKKGRLAMIFADERSEV